MIFSLQFEVKKKNVEKIINLNCEMLLEEAL